ncbi:MAG: WD40/YVTN/BNR-like repeat-containing protein [Flavobacteriales bacterium]
MVRSDNTFKLFLLVISIIFGPWESSAQWSQTNTGINDLSQGAAVLGASQTHLFAKAGFTLYRSNDNGDTWTAATTPVPFNSTECGLGISGRYFAGLNASTECIYWTIDNGDSWNTVTNGPATTAVRGFLATNSHLFAYTSSAGVYRAALPGDDWASANTGLTNTNVIGMLQVGGDLYANTIGGGVFISTDDGSTWSASNSGIDPGDLFGVNLWAMGGDLYYTAQGGGKYTSTDGGTTWSAWAGLPQLGLGLLEVKRFGNNLYMETRHFADGLRDSLYLSINEGATWTNITGNLNAADLNGSGVFEHNGCLFIGYNLISPGQGLFRRCSSASLPEQGLAYGLRLYPDPTEGAVVLELPDDAVGRSYRVLDLHAAEVVRGRLTATRMHLDLSALAAGSYLLTVEGVGLAPVRLVKQ